MAFNVNEIRANLIGDGARPSLFEVTMVNPVTSVGDAKLRYMVQAAQIPPSDVSVINVPYFGRQIKVAGTRVYPNWTVTVLNDEDFTVRRAFEAWHSAINSHQGNIKTINNYRTTAEVVQFAKDGSELRRYQFANIWPTIINPIILDWANGDQIETFDVEFAYDYWTVDDSLVF
jgi:hypothetical protein